MNKNRTYYFYPIKITFLQLEDFTSFWKCKNDASFFVLGCKLLLPKWDGEQKSVSICWLVKEKTMRTSWRQKILSLLLSLQFENCFGTKSFSCGNIRQTRDVLASLNVPHSGLCALPTMLTVFPNVQKLKKNGDVNFDAGTRWFSKYFYSTKRMKYLTLLEVKKILQLHQILYRPSVNHFFYCAPFANVIFQLIMSTFLLYNMWPVSSFSSPFFTWMHETQDNCH